jgi:pimeloyl-ACP methyl ester carboxylesterase
VLDDLHLEQVHLLGYSKGGLVTQYLAHHARQRLLSIALTVTFSYKMLTPLERMQRNFLPSVIKRLGAKGMSRMMYDGIAGGVNMNLTDFTAFKRMLADCRDDVLLQAGHSLFKFDSRDWLPGFTTPTLVIGGTDDIVVPIHHPRYLAANIPGAQLKILERAGHGMVYTHTQRLAGFVRNFFLQEPAG